MNQKPYFNVASSPSSLQEEVCMICLDHVPDTMVLPCEHRVVCETCSEGLKNTNDARICVKCRQPITKVITKQEIFGHSGFEIK